MFQHMMNIQRRSLAFYPQTCASKLVTLILLRGHRVIMVTHTGTQLKYLNLPGTEQQLLPPWNKSAARRRLTVVSCQFLV
jgi:hypothetical protein